MKIVTKDQFYASVGALNVHPHILQGKYPYTMEWKTPSGQIMGKIVPETGAYPHLFTNIYLVADSIEIDSFGPTKKQNSAQVTSSAKTSRPNLLEG